MRLKSTLVLVLLLVFSGGVLADHHESTSFTVTIENVSGIGLFENTGVSAVPVGGDGAGPALPGGAYEFVIQAVAGDTLTFATMLAQSNDLFFAPDEAGIALFDDDGNAISGDVSDQVDLWDVGTEVNQPIGEGDEQAPRQSGPNNGADETGVVQLVSDLDDGFAYPAASDIVSVTLTAGDMGEFNVRIENVLGRFDVRHAYHADRLAGGIAGHDDRRRDDDERRALHLGSSRFRLWLGILGGRWQSGYPGAGHGRGRLCHAAGAGRLGHSRRHGGRRRFLHDGRSRPR